MLEKSCSSSATTSSNTTNHANHHNYNNYLKPSHKISKPIIRRTPPLPDNHLLQQQQQQNQELQTENQQQNQPPVYNINKSDFRQVVQKLTGSPAHDRSTAPPPLPPPPPPSLPPTHSPKPQSSRLQRIRPPPLAHLQSGASPDSFGNSGRSMPMQMTPFSPLPPLPTVHVAAESPISAYMKYIRSSNLMLQQPQQVGFPSPNSAMGSSQFALPNSPLAFGKIPSPRSPYPLLLSPRSAQFGFPQFQY